MLHFSFLIALTLSVLVATINAQRIPTQVHIALAGIDTDGNPNGMAVSWNTVNQTPSSKVKFGTVSKAYTDEVSGTSSAYYEVIIIYYK